MCGYLMYENKPTAYKLQHHLELQRNRGEDGFGAIHLETGKIVKALEVNDFVDKFAASMPKKGSIIVHHRKASLGGITTELVHPLRCAKHKHVVMQNGTKKSLVEVTGTTSDTQSILKLWHLMKDSDMLEHMLWGGGLVFIWDKGSLHASHDGMRTLFYCEKGPDKGMFSSAPLSEGSWCECPALEGINTFPLNVVEWVDFLPLAKAELFVKNTAYYAPVHYTGTVSRNYDYGAFIAPKPVLSMAEVAARNVKKYPVTSPYPNSTVTSNANAVMQNSAINPDGSAVKKSPDGCPDWLVDSTLGRPIRLQTVDGYLIANAALKLFIRMHDTVQTEFERSDVLYSYLEGRLPLDTATTIEDVAAAIEDHYELTHMYYFEDNQTESSYAETYTQPLPRSVQPF